MIAVNNFFDQVYCINLDERTDRWEHASKEFLDNDIKVKRVSAIKLKNKTSIDITSGATGLILTHRAIYIDAIKNKYKNILIFEDDIIFANDFKNKFDAAIKELPDNWDVFYLGGQFWFDTPIKYSESLSITNKTLATHAISFSQSILFKMLNLTNLDEPLDITLANNQHLFNSYITRETLVDQVNFFTSDINKTKSTNTTEPFYWNSYEHKAFREGSTDSDSLES